MAHPTTIKKREATALLEELRVRGPYVGEQIDRAARAVHDYRALLDRFTLTLESLARGRK